MSRSDVLSPQTNWVPLRLTREYMPNASKLPFKLRPTRTGTSLTNGESLLADNIGDLRVTFEGVLSGPCMCIPVMHFTCGADMASPDTAGVPLLPCVFWCG